jgi:hypothetical protein
MRRDGNIVSRIIREAWDCCGVLRTMTKAPHKATKPFISIIGHITIEELQQALDRVDMANGYANRFLYACVKRSSVLLPFGGEVDAAVEALLGAKTLQAVETARTRIEAISMTQAAREFWAAEYPALSAARPGLLAAITARAEAQTMRLALLYALLDGASEIDQVHLEAALAVWRFSAASAKYIFGDLLGDPLADTILRALRMAGTNGMTRTDINGLFGGHRPGPEIARALMLLIQFGKGRCVKTPTGGRPIESWFFV